MNPKLFDLIGILLTKAWGHMLIPVILGTLCWLIAGWWHDYELLFWVAWVGLFLVIGWVLTICFWVRHYWAIYRHDPD